LTEYTRPATWDDGRALARHLNEAGADYALVDAYAIAAHGYSRFSEDIDIPVSPSAENSRRWILALSNLPDRAAAELATEGDVFADDKRYAIRINDEFTVDVMPSIRLKSRPPRDPSERRKFVMRTRATCVTRAVTSPSSSPWSAQRGHSALLAAERLQRLGQRAETHSRERRNRRRDRHFAQRIEAIHARGQPQPFIRPQQTASR
jgi:hypothetical protein